MLQFIFDYTHSSHPSPLWFLFHLSGFKRQHINMKLSSAALWLGVVAALRPVQGASDWVHFDMAKWYNWLICENWEPFNSDGCPSFGEPFAPPGEIFLTGKYAPCDEFPESLDEYPTRDCAVDIGDRRKATVIVPIINWVPVAYCNKKAERPYVDELEQFEFASATLDGKKLNVKWLADYGPQLMESCPDGARACSLDCGGSCAEELDCEGLDNSPTGGFWVQFDVAKGKTYELVVKADKPALAEYENFCIAVKYILDIK